MTRFQAALKNYLTKQIEQVNLDLHELVHSPSFAFPQPLLSQLLGHSSFPLVSAEDSKEEQRGTARRARGDPLWGTAAAGAAAGGAGEEPQALLAGGRGAAAAGAGAAQPQGCSQGNLSLHRAGTQDR